MGKLLKITTLLLAVSVVVSADQLKPPLRRMQVERVVDVYDGDTATLDIRVGLDSYRREKVRLYGIDTPEVRPLKSRVEGEAARDYLRDRLEGCPLLEVIVGTDADGMAQRDKYGRLLVGLECVNDDIVKTMIDLGLGRPYFGGSK